MPDQQPAGMQNTTGVIVSIGVVCNNDRMAITLPMATQSTLMTNNDFPSDALGSILADASFANFLTCLSSDAYVSFISGEGMVDGMTPGRLDFSDAEHPGTGPATAVPSSVCGLMFFYEDPEDATLGQRTKQGRNFIPAVSTGNLDGDMLDNTYKTALGEFANALQGGIASALDPDAAWYRVLAAPLNRSPGQPLNRTLNNGARGYVATQRRRLIPR